MDWFIIITSMFGLLSIGFILSLKSQKVITWLDKKRVAIDHIHNLAAAFTIISLFITSGFFYYDQKEEREIREDNNRIILENLDAEIEGNIRLSKFLLDNEKHFKDTDEFTADRYRLFNLDESKIILPCKEDRRLVIELLDHIQTTNKEMDELNDITLIPPAEYARWALMEIGYKKLRNESLSVIAGNSKDIQTWLPKLRKPISEYLDKKFDCNQNQ